MTIYTIEDVQKITAEIQSKLDACDNGEGMECASLDASLQHYARSCCKFSLRVREWAQGVFSGKFPSNPQIEQAWREEGDRLLRRCSDMLLRGEQADVPCYDLPGQSMLRASLWELSLILSNWVAPKLSVAPSARVSFTPEDVEAASNRIAELPPLPEGWQPEDQRQRTLYRKAKTS
jgi:hypothetical protein